MSAAEPEAEMFSLIEKLCRIRVVQGGVDLFFSGLVLDVSQDHVTFRDKFGVLYCFRSSDVVSIQECRNPDPSVSCAERKV